MKPITKGSIESIGILVAEIDDDRIPELRQEAQALREAVRDKVIINIELVRV